MIILYVLGFWFVLFSVTIVAERRQKIIRIRNENKRDREKRQSITSRTN